MTSKRNRLSDRATAILTLSDAERIHYIRKDKWLGHKDAKKVLNHLSQLLAYPRLRVMPHTLLIGERGFGRATIMHRFHEKNPPLPESKNETLRFSRVPVLLIESPTKPDEQRLYFKLLDAINSLPSESVGAAELESRTYTLLKNLEVKILMIKHIDDIIVGQRQAYKDMRKALMKLSEEAQLSLALSGTIEAKIALDDDPRTENLFEPLYLTKWSLVDSGDLEKSLEPPEEFRRFLNSYEHILPLKKASNLSSPAMAKTILESADGIIGEVTTLLKQAAELAITSDVECINQDILTELDYKSPAERKIINEQIARGLGLA